MSINATPQAGPAIALAQLLTEHPQLPPLRWSLNADGLLMGSNLELGCDPRPVAAAYAEALGARIPVGPVVDSNQTVSLWMHATWRDVELSVMVGAPVAVVGALDEQRHQFFDAAVPPESAAHPMPALNMAVAA